MPPAKTPSRVAAGRPPGGRRPPTDGRGRGGRPGFGGRFSRFGGGSREAAKGRANVGTLLRDVRNELRKVEWPTREELTKLTAAVVALSALIGTFLGGVDFIFQELIKVIISLSNGGV